MFKFELGVCVKDVITGFSGVLTARCQYLTGCIQYVVTSQKMKNDKIVSFWFDEDRLQKNKEAKVKIKVKNAGGPQDHPSKS